MHFLAFGVIWLCACQVPSEVSTVLPSSQERIPAWELAPPEVKVGPVTDSDNLYRFQLANGLKVILLRDMRLPYISLGLATRNGAASVDPLEAGLAAFTAGLMERGAGDNDSLAFAQVVETLGADFDVSAGWDSINVKIGGLSSDFDHLTQILADVVLSPRFKESDAQRLKAELLGDMERDRDDPRELVARAFSAALYPGHRYGLAIDGDPGTLSKLEVSDARKFYGRSFVPRNAVLYASGAVDFASFRDRMEKLFGSWTGKRWNQQFRSPLVRNTEGPTVVLVDRPDLSQAHILIGHEGISRTDERRIPASLGNLILGGAGFSSRLMTRVRSESGLTYGVHSYFTVRRHSGPFVVSTFTRVQEVGRVVGLVLNELANIMDQPPDQDEVRNAKGLLAGRFALGLETSKAVIRSLVDLDIHGLPDNSLDTFRRRVKDINHINVSRVISEVFHVDRVIIVVVGPAEIMSGQLSGLGKIITRSP